VKCTCGTELIWGGDHDCDPDDEFLIVSNLHCPDCKREVLIYTPRPPEGAQAPAPAC